jgi:phage tail protein X
MIATAQDGETVDALCWRVLGRTQGVTEQVLDLNRGLAAVGPELPGGTEVILPDVSELAIARRESVNLWDD